jgi:putative endonuclease
MTAPWPAASPNERPGNAIGARGEDLAAAHLERLGLRVIARNVRVTAGEIDLIAFDGSTLVFVEVKSARSRGAAHRSGAAPLARLGTAQRRRLRRLAVRWLAETPQRPRAKTLRFDAIGVLMDHRGALARLDHVEGAW